MTTAQAHNELKTIKLRGRKIRKSRERVARVKSINDGRGSNSNSVEMTAQNSPNIAHVR